MAGIAAVAAVISYSDGLFLVRLAGNTDWHAYLYPLLPDGLIVICLIALLAVAANGGTPGIQSHPEARGSRRAPGPAGDHAAGASSATDDTRPRWPTFGLGLGIALTLAMNVAAGVAHSPLDAVVDGFVPVVFFVAVEVFIGYVRRGRGGAATGARDAGPATMPACGHVVGDPADAIRVAVEHARECLDEKVTIRGLSRQLGVDHRKVSMLARPAAGPPAGEGQPPYDPPAGVAPGTPPAPPAGAQDVPAGFPTVPPVPAGTLNGDHPEGR